MSRISTIPIFRPSSTPTAPVGAPLFARAGHRTLSGMDLLHAFILGVDVECRIGNAVSPGHYRRGWHITSTCGVFGAAAGAGQPLGAPPPRLPPAPCE